MSNLRRGAAAALVVLAAATSLTACGGESKSNSDYAPVSNVEYNPVDGINLDSTHVRVRNLYLLAGEGVLPPRLRMTMVNPTLTPDALVGATIGLPPVGGRLIGGTLGAVPVTAGSTVIVGSDGGAQITFRGADVKAGTWVPVTLLFRNGRAVAGQILVQSALSQFSDGTLPVGVPQVQRGRAALEEQIRAEEEAAEGEGGSSEVEGQEPAADDPALIDEPGLAGEG